MLADGSSVRPLVLLVYCVELLMVRSLDFSIACIAADILAEELANFATEMRRT